MNYCYNIDSDTIISNTKIKLCVIGSGRAGKFHINSLSINKNYELLYVIDKNKNKARELSKVANCNYSNDLDWVLNNIEFDAIIICTTILLQILKYSICLNFISIIVIFSRNLFYFLIKF